MAVETPDLESLHGWAAEVLELNGNTAPDAARQAYMRRLAGNEFVGNLRDEYALWLLSGERGSPPHGYTACWREIEERLRDEVEAFSRQFFALAPEARQQRWRALSGSCGAFPALRRRLDALRPGLAAIEAEFARATPPLQRVGRAIGELFVLPPAVRAARRAELIAEFRREGHSWDVTVKGFEQKHPEWSKLETSFLEQIRSVDISAPVPTRPVPATVAKVVNRQQESGHATWPYFVAIFVALKIFVAVSKLDGCSSGPSNQRNSYPQYNKIPPLPPEVLRALEEQRRQPPTHPWIAPQNPGAPHSEPFAPPKPYVPGGYPSVPDQTPRVPSPNLPYPGSRYDPGMPQPGGIPSRNTPTIPQVPRGSGLYGPGAPSIPQPGGFPR